MKRRVPTDVADLLDDAPSAIVDHGYSSLEIDSHSVDYQSYGFGLVKEFLKKNIDSIRIETDRNYDTRFYWKDKYLFTTKNVLDREINNYLTVIEISGRRYSYPFFLADTTMTQVCAKLRNAIMSRFKEQSYKDKDVVYISFYNCRTCACDYWIYEFPKGLRLVQDGWKNHVPIPEFYTILEEECERFCLIYGLTEIRYEGPHLARKPQSVRLRRL